MQSTSEESPAPSTTLGLDIGSNSIGWALVSETGQKIIATGVRVFPEGVDRDQTGGELPKNQARRVARGMRRQIRRRARRKRLLREALVVAGLLPRQAAEQSMLDGRNPYELRCKGLRDRLTPHELGRVLVHINQRRGFLSNRKADRGKKSETSKMLAQISSLQTEIEQGGHATLGEHLGALYSANPEGRIRGRHTRREMLLREFDAIWEEQKKYHAELLNEELKYGQLGPASYPRRPLRSGGSAKTWLRQFGICGIIFFQRPMYWPNSVVGRCELNPKEKRCRRADRVAQRFRVLNELNNLRIITGGGEIKELTPPQRQTLIAFVARKEAVTFDDIRKKLGLLESDGFNLEAGDRRKLLGMATDALLASKKYYGPTWHDQSEAWKSGVVRSLIDDDEVHFQERARIEFSMPTDVAERMIDAPLPEGYASYGRQTMRNRAAIAFIPPSRSQSSSCSAARSTSIISFLTPRASTTR